MTSFKFNPGSFRKYFANTSWLMAEKIFRSVVNLVVGVWVVRYLGPERFGLLSYAMSFVFLFSAIANLGLEGIIVRNLVNAPHKKDVLIGTAFWLKVVGALGALVFISVSIQFTSNDHLTNILIFIIAGGLLFQSFNVIDFYFQSKVLSKYVAFAQFLQVIISSLIKLTLIFLKVPLLWFAVVLLLDSLVLATGLITMYLKQRLSFSTWRFNYDVARQVLKSSFPLIFSWIAVTIYMKIDQVMIKEMLGTNAVGNYAAAVRLCEAWYFIPIVITSSLFPAIINAKKTDEKLYYDRIQKLYDLMVWLSVLIAIPIAIFGNKIIDVLFGIEFGEAAQVLKIYIWATPFVFLNVASAKWLINENLTRISLYRAVCGSITNIILNIILIPKYGITGAAWTTFISQFIASYSFDLFNEHTFISFKMKTKALFLYNIFSKFKIC